MLKLRSIKEFFRTIGPGIVTGSADDDPSGIATYSQAGAQSGTGFLWSALFTFPLMTAVQEMCARIGLATGRGLVGNLRQHYPKWVLYFITFLVFTANTINIGANLAGMAAASNLLLPLPSLFWLAIYSTVIIVAMIFLPYHRFAAILKWLAFGLLAYILVPFMSQVNWEEALRATFIPQITFDRAGILIVIAILGTTISPYLFFWQASMEVQEERGRGKTLKNWIVTKHEIKLMREDVTFGMFISNVVMWFIMLATATTLYANGITNIETAEQAASALRPFAGDAAYLLFTLGIVGTGFLAVPVLSGSASYAISEIFGWREGFDRQFNRAKGFYLVVITSTLLGAVLSLVGFSPIDMLIYTAVIYGLISPVLIFFILHLANNQTAMGDKKNGWVSNLLVGTTLLVMTLASLAFIYISFFT